MLFAETASTMPIARMQEGKDFAAAKTTTAPGASALSTMMRSNFVLESFCTASRARSQFVTFMFNVFSTSPTRLISCGSRENRSELMSAVGFSGEAMVVGLYNFRRRTASYLSRKFALAYYRWT